MYKTTTHSGLEAITVAQLCEALADGTLPAQLEGDSYVVRNSDLLRFAHSYALKLTDLASPDVNRTRPAHGRARRAS